MASADSERDAKDALSKFLQMGTVVEYQMEFERLIKRVTKISKSLLKSERADDVFDIGETNVESMEVRSKFDEFSENKESLEEVVGGGGEVFGVDKDDDLADTSTDGGVEDFKWGVQEASAFEKLKQQLSTTSVLSLPDFNEVLVGPRMSLAAIYQKEVVVELPEESKEGQPLEKPMAIRDLRVVFFKTAMQRRIWKPDIKIVFRPP
ncbi:hypothetical protein Tco_0818083 [Tanacetum coccineum]